ncbi:MAG: lipopolysaccharide biosynthesis protein, partial [Acidobacteriia bacterium]|nr:lipopolysaccharide biosynthesis protein [Terriglobia bacterium]
VGGDSDAGRFIGILRSRTVANHVIDRFGLMKVYGASKRETARIALQQHTTITEERRTGQIVLRFTDHDAKRAAAVAQAYIDELNALNAQLNTTAAHREREFLEQRIKEVGAELNTAAEQLSKFSKKNTMIGLGDQQKAMLESAAKLQGELIGARVQLSGLEQTYGDQNYRVREAQARVSRLARELQTMRGNDSGDAKGAMFPPIRELPELGVTYAELYKQTKTLGVTSEMLGRQLELVKTEEAKELPIIRVLDPPEVPQSKMWPPRKLIVACALLLSFLFAVGWVIARQAWVELSPDHDLKVAVAAVGAWWRERRWRAPRMPPAGAVHEQE